MQPCSLKTGLNVHSVSEYVAGANTEASSLVLGRVSSLYKKAQAQGKSQLTGAQVELEVFVKHVIHVVQISI